MEMHSEFLCWYSKAKQYRPGFILLSGSLPAAEWEVTGPARPEGCSPYCLIQGMGRYRMAAPCRLQRETFQSHDILFVTRGDFSIGMGGREISLQPGEAILTGQRCRYTVTCEETDGSLFILSFCGTAGEQYEEILKGGTAGKNGIALRSPQKMETLLQSLRFMLEFPSRANTVLSVTMVMQILTEIYLSTRRPDEYEGMGQPPWLHTALGYMESHLSKKITVEELAAACGMSSSCFYAKFREFSGCTPYAYITRLRLSRAREMLASEEWTVKYIAYAVGFPAVNHFIEAFRRAYGCTPEVYRKAECREQAQPS